VRWFVRAQQGDRGRRIGVLMSGDENDPEQKRRIVTSVLPTAKGLAIVTSCCGPASLERCVRYFSADRARLVYHTVATCRVPSD
jgi:hypothetical protein